MNCDRPAFSSDCENSRDVKTLIEVAVPLSTFLLLVAVGLDLTADDFVRLRRQRALMWAGLLAPVVLLPPIAVALARLFHASPEVAAGVFLVAACPIGSISTTYSYLARASTALSVTLAGLSCLLAGITIPLIGKGFELALSSPFPLQAPLPQLLTQLLLVLVLPVAVGMLGRWRAPALAARVGARLQTLVVISVLFVLGLVIANDWTAFARELSTTVPLAAVFVMVTAAAGWLTAVPLTASQGDRFVIAAGFGARNVGIATTIAVTLLGRVDFARFAATYALTEIPVMLVAVALFRSRSSIDARLQKV